jgi:hypothetical protein
MSHNDHYLSRDDDDDGDDDDDDDLMLECFQFVTMISSDDDELLDG